MTFNFYTIFFGCLFGAIGFGSWRYGRKISSPRHLILGAALMGYSYFIPNEWVSLLIGTLLTLFLFWP